MTVIFVEFIDQLMDYPITGNCASLSRKYTAFSDTSPSSQMDLLNLRINLVRSLRCSNIWGNYNNIYIYMLDIAWLASRGGMDNNLG